MKCTKVLKLTYRIFEKQDREIFNINMTFDELFKKEKTKKTKKLTEPLYIKLFGSEFVKFNYKRYKIIFQNKTYDLTEKIKVPDNIKEKIEIYLLVFSDIINGYCMFNDFEDDFDFSLDNKSNSLLEIKEICNVKKLFKCSNIIEFNTNKNEDIKKKNIGDSSEIIEEQKDNTTEEAEKNNYFDLSSEENKLNFSNDKLSSIKN